MHATGLYPVCGALLIASFLVLETPAPAGEAGGKLPSSFDPKGLDRFFQAEAQCKGRVGFSAAIVKNGQVMLARGYGWRSLAGRLPVENETLFAIGSLTKQFTCACVLMLAEEGKLSVHDPVAKYFPDLTRAANITLLDLMNHTSGYPDYYPLDFVDSRMMKAVETDEAIRQYAGGRLDFEPGTRFSYSNTGYLILGRVVEKVTGQAFGDFLQNRILGPLGMQHTAYSPAKPDPRLAVGYCSFALSPPEPAVYEGDGWTAAAGAMYSTPSDLARWDLALMEGKVLKPESWKLMTTPRQLPDGATTEYGCGLRAAIQQKRLVLSHTGMVGGFYAWNAMIPSTRSAVILLSNNGGGLGGMPEQILNLLLQERSQVPTISGLATEDAIRKVFAELQHDRLDRSQLAPEFNAFLTPQKASEAAKRLRRFGKPRQVEVLSTHERGRLEVSEARLTFKSGTLKTLMYRRTDGVIEQFFVDEE